LFPELSGSKLVLTNAQRVHGPNVADQAFALLLALTRDLHQPGPPNGELVQPGQPRRELRDKTMLVIGLGGIGTQISRRADAFGMRVMAIDPKEMQRPSFVFSLDKPTQLMDLLPKADVVVLACP